MWLAWGRLAVSGSCSIVGLRWCQLGGLTFLVCVHLVAPSNFYLCMPAKLCVFVTIFEARGSAAVVTDCSTCMCTNKEGKRICIACACQTFASLRGDPRSVAAPSAALDAFLVCTGPCDFVHCFRNRLHKTVHTCRKSSMATTTHGRGSHADLRLQDTFARTADRPSRHWTGEIAPFLPASLPL